MVAMAVVESSGVCDWSELLRYVLAPFSCPMAPSTDDMVELSAWFVNVLACDWLAAGLLPKRL